jgi:hypothetical protein
VSGGNISPWGAGAWVVACGVGKVIARPRGNAEPPQRGDLEGCLDAFGDDGCAGLGGEGDESRGEGPAYGVGVDALGECDIELEDVGADTDQVLQAGVTGAGVVHGDADTSLPVPVQSTEQAVVIGDATVLGEFKHDVLGRQTVEDLVEIGRGCGPGGGVDGKERC